MSATSPTTTPVTQRWRCSACATRPPITPRKRWWSTTCSAPGCTAVPSRRCYSRQAPRALTMPERPPPSAEAAGDEYVAADDRRIGVAFRRSLAVLVAAALAGVLSYFFLHRARHAATL